MHKVGPFHTSPDICEAYNTQYLTHGMARISAVPICKPQANTCSWHEQFRYKHILFLFPTKGKVSTGMMQILDTSPSYIIQAIVYRKEV